MYSFFEFLMLYSVSLLLNLECTQAQDGIFAGIEGSFCESRVGGCCPGREDSCHTPILDHLCYCDDFCDGSDTIYRKDHDCCPDFYFSCQGLPRTANLTAVCYHHGTPYRAGSTRKDNCNQCNCVGDSGIGVWQCEDKECMIDPQHIEVVNSGDFSWKASNYSEFWGRYLSDGITYRLGTLLPEKAVYNMRPVRQTYEPGTLPRSFDARSNRNWPNYIQRITDQGWCGSDWAATTAAVTADRLAIQSKGSEINVLSAQHLLSCDKGQQGCKGGHLDRTWNFMRAIGIVDEDCYPYVSGTSGNVERCMISRKASLHDCTRSNPPADRMQPYKTGPAYRISDKEEDIQYEIMTYGPVQAVMEVSADFFMYRSGVYRKTNLRSTSLVGFHSVRILGWGEEYYRGQSLKYWTIANSWGTSWGENGIFRILRGENECDIEKFVIAAWAKLAHEEPFKSRKQLKSLRNDVFAKWDNF